MTIERVRVGGKEELSGVTREGERGAVACGSAEYSDTPIALEPKREAEVRGTKRTRESGRSREKELKTKTKRTQKWNSSWIKEKLGKGNKAEDERADAFFVIHVCGGREEGGQGCCEKTGVWQQRRRAVEGGRAHR